jgi:aminoglycoside phosphotransferase
MPLAEMLERISGRLTNELFMARMRSLVPHIVRDVTNDGHEAAANWRLRRIQRTLTGIAVMHLGPPTDAPVAILMLPQTAAGVRLLRRHASAIAQLHADEASAPIAHLVPRVIRQGEIQRQYYLLMEALPGESAIGMLSEPAHRATMLRDAAELISGLHRRSRRPLTIDLLTSVEWIDRPAQTINALLDPRHREELRLPLERLRDELHESLASRNLFVGWIHGDFWPGNLLVDRVGAITGIVDWDRADRSQPPFHDLLHLVLYTRKLLRNVEPGEVIRDALLDPAWTNPEQRVLESLGADGMGERPMLLLYWLRFIAASLDQSLYFARNRRWIQMNIDEVLRGI